LNVRLVARSLDGRGRARRRGDRRDFFGERGKRRALHGRLWSRALELYMVPPRRRQDDQHDQGDGDAERDANASETQAQQ
jgi:hypothetical protein